MDDQLLDAICERLLSSLSTEGTYLVREAETFALRAEDLKFVANQFRGLHSKKLQHTFRFYSDHWRAWAPVQKEDDGNNLTTAEPFALDEKEDDETGRGEEKIFTASSNPSQAKLNLGVTNSRCWHQGLQQILREELERSKMLRCQNYKKPEEPDFSNEPDDD